MSLPTICWPTERADLPRPETVRLFSKLSIAALKARQDKELALWYCLRAINSWGSGYLDRQQAVTALAAGFGYSETTAYRHLKAGMGSYWNIDQVEDRKTGFRRSQIQILGLENVARHLGVRHLGRRIQVPVSEFRTSRLRRAWLYASFYRPRGVTANRYRG